MVVAMSTNNFLDYIFLSHDGYGYSAAYFEIVSPVSTNSSPVPARIPDLICLATMGSPFGNSASTLHTKRQELFPKLTTRYCVHETNDFPNGASGLRAECFARVSQLDFKNKIMLVDVPLFFKQKQ